MTFLPIKLAIPSVAADYRNLLRVNYQKRRIAQQFADPFYSDCL